MAGRQIEVSELFPLNDRAELIAHLVSFDWDWTTPADVVMKCGACEVRLVQIGTGTMKGVPVLRLRAHDGWENVTSFLRCTETQGPEPMWILR